MKVRNAFAALDGEADALAAEPVNIGHVAIATALSYTDFRFAHLAWRLGNDRITSWYETFAQRPSVINTAHVDL
jgi:hypothetical protein